MKKIINIISKISIFSLIGVGLNIYLIYTFLSLWIHPQINDVEMIFNLTVLLFFEFVMVHSGVFMSILGRQWKAWLFFIIIYGLFALAFNSIVSGNQILILYGVVILNRMLPNILRKPEDTEKKEGIIISAIYAMIYFFLFIIIIYCASYVPPLGLTKEFLESTNFSQINTISGNFSDKPYIMMCFGALYYLFLTLVEVIMIVRKVKKQKIQ